MSTKKLYIDIYHLNFEDDSLTTKTLDRLHKMEITTNINVGDIVSQLKHLIFKHYNDGLYIRAEEFEDFCYLNIILMFGKEHDFLVHYLESINDTNAIKPSKVLTTEQHFISIDHFFNQQEIEELQKELGNSGISTEIYFIERSAFERGAGDYHEDVILALITGSVKVIGSRVTNYFMDKYIEPYNPRITTLNTEKILNYISKETGINKHDLHITKLENISEEIIKIRVINRYKTTEVKYNKKSKSIDYVVENKTDTMI